MTRYSTNHIPGDDGRNDTARMMNLTIDFAEQWGKPMERREVAKLMAYLAERDEIEESEEPKPETCRNPEHEDRV